MRDLLSTIEEMDIDENETFVENRQEKVEANMLKLESILSKMRELYKNSKPNQKVTKKL